MPISGIGSGASLIPSLELPGRETRSTEQRATLSQVAALLPGSREQADTEERGPSHMSVDIDGFGPAFNRRLQFEVDHESSEIIVKVIDKTTDEVVRVLPPEELQRLYRSPQETIGFLLSEQA